jgi:hypothetical protein
LREPSWRRNWDMAGDRARVRVTSERARAINQKPKNQNQTVEGGFSHFTVLAVDSKDGEGGCSRTPGERHTKTNRNNITS